MAVPSRWYRYGAAIGGLAVLVVAFLMVSRPRSLGPSGSPWFGRGARLPRLPYCVVVGPVDDRRGIPGVLEIGMTREEVVTRLGTPLVKGLGWADPDRYTTWDSENVMNDLMGGVFAWVQYGGEPRRVISIDFDLEGFQTGFGGQQKVLLCVDGSRYLLSRELHKEEVLRKFASLPRRVHIREHRYQLVLEGTGASLLFGDDMQLRQVGVVLR